MMLIWSAHSVADREAIFDHVLAENPQAAIRLDERLSAAANHLCEFPMSGRAGRVDGTRELVVAGTPYIIAYHVGSDWIRILRLLHGAQQWPDGF